MPLISFKTIDDGEEVIVYNHRGVAKVVGGPARLTLWRSRLVTLRLFYAKENEYLEVNQRAGPKLCIPGPAQMFLNPVVVESILVKEAIFLNANEVLLVYSSCSDPHHQPKTNGQAPQEKLLPGGGESTTTTTTTVNRRILCGPLKHVPQPNEWIHEFVWHGSDPSDKTRKVPGGTRFIKLRVVADQFYYNVREVRTKDDTQIVIKLMIFFQLDDIEKMLDKTYDPIADMINAVCADTIQFCAALTYAEFVEQTAEMNKLSTFSQLTTRVAEIGYTVNKVVFRGFHANDALQRMHDSAIQERTRLRLEADTEDHRQARLDLQLAKEEERNTREQELERERAEHRHRMEEAEHRLKLDRQKESDQERLAMKRAEMMLELERIQKIVELGVDASAVLVAETGKADRTLRLESALGSSAPVNLHLHE